LRFATPTIYILSRSEVIHHDVDRRHAETASIHHYCPACGKAKKITQAFSDTISSPSNTASSAGAGNDWLPIQAFQPSRGPSSVPSGKRHSGTSSAFKIS